MELDQNLQYVILQLWTFCRVSFIPYVSNYLALNELNPQMPSLVPTEDRPLKILR